MTNLYDLIMNCDDPECVRLGKAFLKGMGYPMDNTTAECFGQLNQSLGYDEEFDSYIQKSEENIEYPYVDTAGYITVGKGHKIGSRQEFMNMPFYIVGQNRPATMAEKESGYTVLIAYGPTNYTAKHFESVTPLRLTLDYLNALYEHDILIRHRELSRMPDLNFNDMRPRTRRATMEVHFNAGMSQFPEARKAAKRKDLNAYCHHLHRRENNDNVKRRNEWTIRECLSGGFIP